MHRRRLRKFILITGTLLSLLIVAAFVVSAWWWIVFAVPTPYGPVLSLFAGSVEVVPDDMVTVPVSTLELVNPPSVAPATCFLRCRSEHNGGRVAPAGGVT